MEGISQAAALEAALTECIRGSETGSTRTDLHPTLRRYFNEPAPAEFEQVCGACPLRQLRRFYHCCCLRENGKSADTALNLLP